MNFLTLHEISLRFDIPVRVLRYRLRQLLQAGKLAEGVDYRRDDFVDETHFVWKLNATSFARIAGIQPVNRPATTAPADVNHVGSESQPAATSGPTTGSRTLPNLDAKPSTIDREMIDILKEQVRMKDGQIADLTSQSKTLTALNEKLTGAFLHQGNELSDLLRLSVVKSAATNVATCPVSNASVVDTRSGNEMGSFGKPIDVKTETHETRAWQNPGVGAAAA
jgi:hypothetical protein